MLETEITKLTEQVSHLNELIAALLSSKSIAPAPVAPAPVAPAPVAPAPVAPAQTEPTAITLETLRQLCVAKAKKDYANSGRIRGILAPYSVANIQGLKPEDYSAVYAAVEAL